MACMYVVYVVCVWCMFLCSWGLFMCCVCACEGAYMRHVLVCVVCIRCVGVYGVHSCCDLGVCSWFVCVMWVCLHVA